MKKLGELIAKLYDGTKKETLGPVYIVRMRAPSVVRNLIEVMVLNQGERSGA